MRSKFVGCFLSKSIAGHISCFRGTNNTYANTALLNLLQPFRQAGFLAKAFTESTNGRTGFRQIVQENEKP